MDALLFGITIVGGAVLFASLGVLLVRQRTLTGALKSHHEVAGYLLSIVGTLYSVLLGLIVVDTQNKYQDAKMITQREADSCLDLFHLSYTTPVDVRIKLQNNLQAYLKAVNEDEWDSISREGRFNESARHAFRNLWWTIVDYEPTTGKEQSAYQKILDVMQGLTDGRRYRLQISQAGVPAVMWGVLIAGAVLTMLFTYLFEVENARAQFFMTAIVALALSLNVLLVALFSNPYKGYMRIAKTSFEYDYRVTFELLKERPQPPASH